MGSSNCINCKKCGKLLTFSKDALSVTCTCGKVMIVGK